MNVNVIRSFSLLFVVICFFYVAAFETHVYCYLDVIFLSVFFLFWCYVFGFQILHAKFFFGFSLPFVWFCLKVVVYFVEVVRILFASFLNNSSSDIFCLFLLKEGFVRCCCCLLLFLYFICSFNCILLRLSVDVFLLLFAKIDKFYTRLVTLTSSVFVSLFFCSICGSECVVGFSSSCIRIWFLAVVCVEFEEERLSWWSAHCFLSREKGRSLAEESLRLVSFSREGTRLLYSREVPGGVAHCWRDDDDDCVGCCWPLVLLVCVLVSVFLWMLSRRDGDFLPRRKSVFVCLFSLCIFFYYECSSFQIVSTMFLTIPIAIRETERRVFCLFVTVL